MKMFVVTSEITYSAEFVIEALTEEDAKEAVEEMDPLNLRQEVDEFRVDAFESSHPTHRERLHGRVVYRDGEPDDYIEANDD